MHNTEIKPNILETLNTPLNNSNSNNRKILRFKVFVWWCFFLSFFLSFLSSFCFASFFLSTHNCYWCIVCTHITRTCMIPLMSHLFGQSLSSTLNKKQQQQKQHDIDAIFPSFKHSEEYKNQAFYFMINSPKWTNKRTCAVDRRILSVKENKRSKNNEIVFLLFNTKQQNENTE